MFGGEEGGSYEDGAGDEEGCVPVEDYACGDEGLAPEVGFGSGGYEAAGWRVESGTGVGGGGEGGAEEVGEAWAGRVQGEGTGWVEEEGAVGGGTEEGEG